MHKLLFSLFLLSLILPSCSVTKMLEGEERLYTGHELKIIAADSVPAKDLEAELESLVNPSPNATLLGWRWRVWFNLKFKTEKEKGFRHWLSTKLGRAPVLYDDVKTKQIVKLMENRAQNLGYFGAAVSHDSLQSSKKVKVNYLASVQEPYRFDSVSYQLRDSGIAEIVNDRLKKSFIKQGEVYELDKLKAERKRIESILNKNGYYYFRADDIEFLADTFNRDVDVMAILKPNLEKRDLLQQRIQHVIVYANYDVTDRTNSMSLKDTTMYEGLEVVCDDCILRSSALAEAVLMRPGQIYDPVLYQRSLSRLNSYNTFKYIQIEVEDAVPESDTQVIVKVYLTPSKPRTISGEIGVAYNTGGYIGPEAAVSYVNRNLFKGAEYLTLGAEVQFNYLLNDNNDRFFPFFGQYKYTASIVSPRLWLPKRANFIDKLSYGDTHLRLSYESERFRIRLAPFQNAIEDLNLTGLQDQLNADSTITDALSIFNWQLQYGYTWRGNPHVTHETNPLTVRLQNLNVDNEEVATLLRSSSPGGNLQNSLSLQRLLVFSPDYTYTYDSRIARKHRHDFLLRQRVSMNWTQVTAEAASLGMFGSQTTTFAQSETDFRYYFTPTAGTTIATRQSFNIGYPITDRAVIPFFDLYSIGGPNSVRSLAPRGTGPGRSNPNGEELLLLTGFGNVRFEGSIEYRQQLDAFFETAVFVDYGNVWKYRTELQDGVGTFRGNSFIKEMAVGTGVGLRINLNILLLRLDFAWPVTIPSNPSGERVVIDNFFKDNWWSENLNFVLAFGYPF